MAFCLSVSQFLLMRVCLCRFCSAVNDVEINRGLDGRLLLYSVRVRDCQWQGHWFNNEVLAIALMRSALSLISACSVNVGSRLNLNCNPLTVS